MARTYVLTQAGGYYIFYSRREACYTGVTSQVSYDQGPLILQKSRSHLKSLYVRRKKWSKFPTGNPQILGATYI